MQGLLGLLVFSLSSVYSQFTVIINQNNADVSSGDSSLCWLDKLDSAVFYSGFKPKLVSPVSAKIAYMSLYSCHDITITELQKWEKATYDCSSAAYLNVKEACGERLMFLWSKAMGEGYEEALPAEISGIKTGDSGYVMLVVTYVDVVGSFMDSSGLELKKETSPAPSGKEGGRMIVGHQLPRLIVMGGVEEWRTMSVCHRSCLNKMDGENIQVFKVGVFTSSRGSKARLGLTSEQGSAVGADILNDKLVKGSFVEKQVDRKVTPGNDLWLECVFNTLDLNYTSLGGVGAGLEHCFAVLTYITRTGITSCRSHPTEYSVLYALDFYLETDDYNSYSDDYYNVDDAFDSFEEDTYDDAFTKRKKRAISKRMEIVRNKREAYEAIEDNFMDKLSNDKSQVKDRIQSLQVQNKLNSSSIAAINSILAEESQYATFCRLGSTDQPVLEVGPPITKPLVSVSAVPRVNIDSLAPGVSWSSAVYIWTVVLGTISMRAW